MSSALEGFRRAFRKAAELVSDCDGLDLDQPLGGRERRDTDEGAGWLWLSETQSVWPFGSNWLMLTADG